MPSPYLTTREAMDYLRYRSRQGFLRAVKRYRIPHTNTGKGKLFLKADLINVWNPERKIKGIA